MYIIHIIYIYIYINKNENIQIYRNVCRKIFMWKDKRVYKKYKI